MASYNGLIALLIKGSSTGGEFAVLTGVSRVATVSKALPHKLLKDALVAVHTQGVSGTYAVEVVSSINGATFVIAGLTGIAADGGITLGASGTPLTIPSPVFVTFSSAEAGSGFTSTVSVAGEY